MRRAAGARMRLLYVQPAVSMGGAERQASLLLPALRDHGIDAIALTGPGELLESKLRRDGVTVVWSELFPDATPFHLLQVPRHALLLARLGRRLDPLHLREPFDLVIGSLGFGWALSGFLAQRWGIPSVWRAGGMTTSSGLFDERQAMAARLLVRWLSPRLLLSNARSVFEFWSGVLPIPGALLPNAVELPPLPRRRARGAGDPLIAGFVGRLSNEKGLPLLVDAMALARARGVDVRLRVAGIGDPRPLFELCEARRLSRHLRFVGRIDALAPFFESVDLLVLPSSTEGASNALLEAMAHGVPIVATAVGGTPELVSSGCEGLLVPPAAPHLLATAIQWMAENPAEALRMGLAGRMRVQGREPRLIASQLARLLRERVHRPSPLGRTLPRHIPA